jgi:hypothetical protein
VRPFVPHFRDRQEVPVECCWNHCRDTTFCKGGFGEAVSFGKIVAGQRTL